ncbi:hypothetical protein FACS1894208_08170 [Clostridia bacterium]|nr:hypothetical protein FACS1894208_08170 [Clostridia bacterium]
MSYELLRKSFPAARKERRCELCGTSIPAGEKYSREVGVFDGDFQDISLHFGCTQIVQECIAGLDSHDLANGFTFDQVWDWHREREKEGGG